MIKKIKEQMLFNTVVQKLNNAPWTERAVYCSVLELLVLLVQAKRIIKRGNGLRVVLEVPVTK